MNENVYLDIEEYRDNIIIDHRILDSVSSETVLLDMYQKKDMKKLKLIGDYYGIKSRIKQDLIINIVLFEIDEKNKDVVFNRLQGWYYLNELKANSFFSKYINL